MNNGARWMIAGWVSILVSGGVFLLAVTPLWAPSPPPAPAQVQEHTSPSPIVPERTLSLVAVGDVMLSRTVDRIMRAQGYEYPFARVRDEIASADIAFANLETSVIDGAPVPSGSMRFRADVQTAPVLAQVGFDIVSLANNHVPDYGEVGVISTVTALTAAQVAYSGAGADDTHAYAPTIIEREGVRVGFLAYNDTDVVPDRYCAAPDRAGTACMDIARMREAVTQLAPTVDIVVVSMHGGTEYVPRANIRQQEFARAAIDAGADIVIGHHPHVVQNIEYYNGHYIIYSLGNFVFDQMWSRDTREGVMARIEFSKKGIEGIQFLPVEIFNYAQPRFITDPESRTRILARLGDEVDEQGRTYQR